MVSLRGLLVVLCFSGTLPWAVGAQGRGGGLGRGNANIEEYRAKQLPPGQGFRVYVVSNMPGMGVVVDRKEVMAGTELGAPAATGTAVFTDYSARFRDLLTQEVNAVIRGARLGGAGSFVVSDAHLGNGFGNILPWALDSTATLMRGFPRPLFMISGLDSTFGAVIFDGAVASAGSQGILPHTFGFSTLTVNGVPLNEVGICALIAGEMGVPVVMVSGDDAAIAETQRMLPGGFVPVVTKYALGWQAGITYSPARVREMLSTATAEAVRRARTGAFKPLTMARPYRVEFALQDGMTDGVADQMMNLGGFTLERTGTRSFRMTASSAREIGYLIDIMQSAVIQ